MKKSILTAIILFILLLTGCGTTATGQHESAESTDLANKETFEIEASDVEDQEDEKEETDVDVEESNEEESDDGSVSAPLAVSGNLKVHFIDVGQADATLFQTDDVTILFDAGNWNRRDAVDYLLSIGVEKIDLLIGSHPDADHIGQMSLILDQFQVDEVWMNGIESTSQTFERTIDKIFEHDVNYHEPRAGESYQLGSLSLDVISPAQLTNDSNEDSISVYFQFGNTGIVMTGDAGVRSERAMMNVRNVSADILHAGHHGSSTSTSQDFLSAVDPDYVIISAGAGNSYGHPHDEVVDRLTNHGAQIYATYQHGTIIFSSDGQEIKLDSTIDHVFVPDQPVASTGKSTPVSKSEPESESERPSTPSSGCIDINSASEAELMEIIHIGEARVKDLIELRPHNTVNGLKRIKGIGDARMKDIIEQDKACVR